MDGRKHYAESFRKEGKYFRGHVSVQVYGDFPLQYQIPFLQALDCPEKDWSTVTDSRILTPSKSVTAVMGISESDEQCHRSGCESWWKRNCTFSKVKIKLCLVLDCN